MNIIFTKTTGKSLTELLLQLRNKNENTVMVRNYESGKGRGAFT
jgi:hypothetical protein